MGYCFRYLPDGQPVFMKRNTGSYQTLTRKKLKLLMDVSHRSDPNWKPLVNVLTGDEYDPNVRVHHKNGDIHDNRLDNLCLITHERKPCQRRLRFGYGVTRPSEWVDADLSEFHSIQKAFGDERKDPNIYSIIRGTCEFGENASGVRIWIHTEDVQRIQNAIRMFTSYYGAKPVRLGKGQKLYYVSSNGLLMNELEGEIRMPMPKRERLSLHSEWCGETFDRVIWNAFGRPTTLTTELYHNLQTGVVLYNLKEGKIEETIQISYRDWVERKRPEVRALYSNDIRTLSDTLSTDYDMNEMKSRFSQMTAANSSSPSRYGLSEVLAIYLDLVLLTSE